MNVGTPVYDRIMREQLTKENEATKTYILRGIQERMAASEEYTVFKRARNAMEDFKTQAALIIGGVTVSTILGVAGLLNGN